MGIKIEIDANSGFCFGVVTAIEKAESELEGRGTLYCLGDIVHNASEMDRLRKKGLVTITHQNLSHVSDCKVLLRAHGEPPSTYRIAEQRGITVVDATCPVVLQLQRRIKDAYTNHLDLFNRGIIKSMPLILIYGKEGHAEVNGLVGQTDSNAIVIQSIEDLNELNLNQDILLYSQTTKSLEGFRELVEEIKKRKTTGKFEYYDTICRQVANRLNRLKEFAATHDAIVFVSGAKSSNGKVLFEECHKINADTIMVSDVEDLDIIKLKNKTNIGICGATSTPRWLMTEIAEKIAHELRQ